MVQVVRENENVTLGCDATGYPKPHIVWRREDGEDIVIGGKKVAKYFFLDITTFGLECQIKEATLFCGVQMNIVERAQLKMEKISRLNMGDYLCVARWALNGFSRWVLFSFQLRINKFSNGIPPSASNRFSVKVQCEYNHHYH